MQGSKLAFFREKSISGAFFFVRRRKRNALPPTIISDTQTSGWKNRRKHRDNINGPDSWRSVRISQIFSNIAL